MTFCWCKIKIDNICTTKERKSSSIQLCMSRFLVKLHCESYSRLSLFERVSSNITTCFGNLWPHQVVVVINLHILLIRPYFNLIFEERGWGWVQLPWSRFRLCLRDSSDGNNFILNSNHNRIKSKTNLICYIFSTSNAQLFLVERLLSNTRFLITYCNYMQFYF